MGKTGITFHLYTQYIVIFLLLILFFFAATHLFWAVSLGKLHFLLLSNEVGNTAPKLMLKAIFTGLLLLKI